MRFIQAAGAGFSFLFVLSGCGTPPTTTDENTASPVETEALAETAPLDEVPTDIEATEITAPTGPEDAEVASPTTVADESIAPDTIPAEDGVVAPQAVVPPATPVTFADALVMKPTIYDDGLACPGGCDAHVVFSSSHNGSLNAFLPPLETRGAPQACKRGEPCMICFGPSNASCILATYRGSGPPKGKFDLTPKFLEATCAKDEIPDVLATYCSSLERKAERSGYNERISCVREPAHAACGVLISEAKLSQELDVVERTLCLEMGESAYNASQTDPANERHHGCDYYKNRREANSSGTTWRRLAPGSCRPGTYVGRDGLDCCDGSVYAASSLHPECKMYFAAP